MTRYIVNEMVCDNRHDLHKMEEPRVFKTRSAADEYVMARITTAYTKENDYRKTSTRGWLNDAGTAITTLYYNGGFSEFYVTAADV